MSQVNVTTDNVDLKVKSGTTILMAAKEAGIDIPTLCHHRALVPIGACRVCVVEVEGQRNLQAACVFPVTEGMKILTESPRVVKARKLVLDMIFAERNHFCPFCEASGNCELQNLGYRYGIDYWVYSTYAKAFPVDATRRYFLMDHNRCILCGRCIRGCSELAANYTLGLGRRGAKSMINADANAPFGESTCISCGTCLQLCPTGAIFDGRSSYMGREVQIERIKSTCSRCSIGCGTEIITRSGNVLRIEGDWDATVNGGRLCKYGRFEPIYETRERVTSPLVRRKGKLEPASWSEALRTAAKYLGSEDAGAIGILASSNATNEALFLMSRLFRQELKVTNVGLLSAAAPQLSDRKGPLDDIGGSDVILVVGTDPAKDQPVASFFVKMAVDKGARLIVADDGENGLSPFAYMNVGTADIHKAVEIAERADHPVVVYGAALTGAVRKELKKLAKKAAFVAIEPGVNTRAAEAYGLNNGFKPSAVKTLFALIGEENMDGKDVLKGVDKEAVIVAQACFTSPLTDRAAVVLPMAIWSERAGTLTNTEGRVLKASKAVEPEGDAKPDWEIVSLLAGKLGRKLGASFNKVSTQATNELK